MEGYREYVARLDRLAAHVSREGILPSSQVAVTRALNGEAHSELRRLVDPQFLRDGGVFFSSPSVAREVANRIRRTVTRESRILDPACGGGDLLIACALTLSRPKSLEATLDVWSRQLLGRELFRDLARVSRLRLSLAAHAARVWSQYPYERYPAFQAIRSGCGLSSEDTIANATHIVMNPPFALEVASEECTWASGTVTSAAPFVERVMRAAQPGARIVAVLPDVLRSGSRYEKWRKLIGSLARVRATKVLGRFSRSADVDVFLLDLELRKKPYARSKGIWTSPARRNTVGHDFDVSVGSVVDYRSEKRGPWRSYATTSDLPPWGHVRTIRRRRRFEGRTERGPFVAVRRNSRPNDKYRVVATIVTSKDRIAVENHLLVLRPKDGRVTSCRELIKELKAERVNRWMNERIRCRHLTVAAMRELPRRGSVK